MKKRLLASRVFNDTGGLVLLFCDCCYYLYNVEEPDHDGNIISFLHFTRNLG